MKKIKLDDVLQYENSNDVWIPGREIPISGWWFERDSDEPVLVVDSGYFDIPDDKYFKGVMTNGTIFVPCYEYKFWHGGPNSGNYFSTYVEKLPTIGEEFPVPEKIIVTRHRTLVEWLRLHGIEGDVIEQATLEDVRGKDVYGILPLWLAAEANSVTEVSMPGLPLDARKRVNGGDFTVEEMDEWGAHLETFVVQRI